MKIGMVAILAFAATMGMQAKDAPTYEKGVLLRMDSSSCGYAEKDGKTIAGEIFGTEGQAQIVHRLCPRCTSRVRHKCGIAGIPHPQLPRIPHLD